MRQGGALVVLLSLGFLPALAAGREPAEPWIEQPFSTPPRTLLEAAAAIPAPRGADVHVLWRETSFVFDGAGRVSYQQRLVYRLLTPAGVASWSATEIEYSPWYQERPVLRARVISPDGREHRLDPATASERPASGGGELYAGELYSDRRVVEAPLPAAVVGAVVEEEVILGDTGPYFSAGTAGAFHLQMYAPLYRGRLLLDAPTTLPLRYGVRKMPGLSPRQEVSGGRVRLRFDFQELPAAGAIEPGLPSAMPRFAQVAWSTGASWRQVAEAYSRQVDEAIARSDLEALQRQLAPAPEKGQKGRKSAAEGTATERIAELVAVARARVRYTGLELGASNLVPAPPGVTLERAFGDCKDKATLVVALLRGEGIPASVALVESSFGKDVEPRLPGLGRFNHALVYVPATPPLWIDPSAEGARVGELPAESQNRWALVASPTTEKLLRTPASHSADNLTRETREVLLAGHGPSRIVETSVYHGEAERQQRAIRGAADDGERHRGYLEYVGSAYLAKGLGEVSESDPQDFSRHYQLRLEALDCERAVTDLSEAVVAIRHDNLVSNLPLALQEGDSPPRENPFIFRQPYVKEWHYRIVPPPGFAPRELPLPIERRLGSARFSREVWREESGEVRALLRFDSGARVATAEQFEQMRRGVAALIREKPLLLWFDHVGARALAEGKPREAIAELRRLAEGEPTKAIHRIRLAQALNTVGLGEEAKRQAHAATRLEPASALAYWSLGFALEHDDLGRRFRPGYDRQAAIDALEHAVELEATASLARAELAILLEYDEEGRRYVESVDLDRAIGQYRYLRDELAAKNLDVNLVSTLFWARRFKELEEATREVEPSETSRYLRIVALAILQGPAAAIREAVNLTASQGEQLDLLTLAAQHLMIAREYPQAAALLRRVARNAENPAAVLGRAEILERARHHETVEIATDSPEAVARSLVATLGRRELEREVLKKLLHPEYMADREIAGGTAGAVLERLRPEQIQDLRELPLDAVTDLALAVLDLAREGDDKRGYRVLVKSRLHPGADPLRLYLTHHQGRWTIAAIDRDFGQIAKEVLRRLERKDLKGAHQWLDWAREVIVRRDAEDPYRFEPFARFWTRGTGAFQDKMRLGAAILMVDQPEAKIAVPVLEETLASLQDPHDPSDETLRRVVETALLRAYVTTHDSAKTAIHARALLEREPDSVFAFLVLGRNLLAEGRSAELLEHAQERLRRHQDDDDALRLLARLALRERDRAGAFGYFEKIRDGGRLEAGDYNLWAWLLLFEEPVPEEALALAQRGATFAGYGNATILFTLAAAYAELGRPGEAHQALLQAVEARSLKKSRLQPDDAYVVGRIAEEYGYAELARASYLRIAPPEDRRAYSVFELAQRKLQALAVERGKKGG